MPAVNPVLEATDEHGWTRMGTPLTRPAGTLSPRPTNGEGRGDGCAFSDSPESFGAELLHFINDVLPTLDRRPRERWHVEADTPLFESGLIDSLAILHLMAVVEQSTGRPIPPRMVVMKHFRTVDDIVQTFWTTEES